VPAAVWICHLSVTRSHCALKQRRYATIPYNCVAVSMCHCAL
jgi:hypothetical protein